VIQAQDAHPDVYGAVFCASPGRGHRPPAVMPSSVPRAYVVAGTLEPFFLKNATPWADALRAAGADVVLPPCLSHAPRPIVSRQAYAPPDE
jgi:hypothetical protein